MIQGEFRLDPREEEYEEGQDLSELLNDGQIKRASEATSIEEYPVNLPILPLTSRVYMPGMAVPIVIEPGVYYDLLKELAKMDHKFLGLVLTKDKDQDIYTAGFDDLYEVGVVARIIRILNIQEAGAQVILNIERRFLIKKDVTPKKAKYLVAKVAYHEEKVAPSKKDTVTAYTNNLVTTIKELLNLSPLFKEELQIVLSHSDFAQPWKLCDFAVALTTASREEMQEILTTFDLIKRMEKALVLLKKEFDITKLQMMINQKIETTINKHQRDYFLKEQLKAIQKELGMAKDDKTVDVERFQERAKKLHFTEEAKKVFDEELEKLGVLDVQSAEYGVVRNYLDILTSLPWGVKDKENNNLSVAEKVLDEDHYGLKDVKERILEYISVGLLKKTGPRGYILCFVGPPGVGKTSIGKSIARALNRKFFRFSLGGMKDESEIKGHRRTYVGAMPGKIIQALKLMGASNPVVMLDEVDKLASSYSGDPASALLEVLDPEQNKEFLDHYIDVRFDLSNILFICTANTLDSIPGPLRDRMEIIRLSGYIEEEKMEITKKYLISKNREEVGLKATDISFKTESLHKIIREYCREAGVRHLEKNINKIMRKVAMQKVRDIEKKKKMAKVEVTPTLVEKYLGKPIFTSERFYSKEKLNGVATGLAWTELGGSLLYIEAVKNRGRDRLKLTGNAGDVMKESSSIAMTYLMSEQARYLPTGLDLSDQEVHIHIPEGATPKDGPSAGVTITTAMISLLSGKPVPNDLAMTGEITLKGKVLPIGGLKEKVLAAKRENIHNIIVPSENKRDWEELPTYLRKGVHVHFVDDYKQVYQLVFGGKRGGV
ncbi:MAG: endopeptidase La [Chlamydiae bacterium]|nr:endopeptidase La [Chlamydiota bacterium]